MSREITETDARQEPPESRLRYILTIFLSLAICALLGVAYIYI